MSQAEFARFAQLNRALKDELDVSAFRQRLRDNVQLLRQRATALIAEARSARRPRKRRGGVDQAAMPPFTPMTWPLM